MIIIPARLESTRLPKKVLADIGGVPMVVATVNAVKSVDDVAVATDSKEVVDVCKSYNIKAIITSREHKSGTDRINEAASQLGLNDNETIINVQADEPFIETEVVKKLKHLVETSYNSDQIMIYSAYKTISKNDAKDPNIVKVIIDESGFAIYFSRSTIPYDRDGKFDDYKCHLGLYGFKKNMLEQFCNLPCSPLEHIEKLEQLRALSHGFKIAMIEVKTKSFSIDTQKDLQKAVKQIVKI